MRFEGLYGLIDILRFSRIMRPLMISKLSEQGVRHLSAVLVGLGIASHIPGREAENIKARESKTVKVEFYRAAEARNGEYALIEGDNGNLFKQRGEIRVRIARIEEDFPASDAVIVNAVYEATEYWNLILEEVDPSVQFIVDPDLINLDCDELKPQDIHSNEVVVCVPYLNEFGFGGDTELNISEGVKENIITNAIVRISNNIAIVREYAKSDDGIPEYIIPRIMAHEFGHVLGLEHGYSNPDSLMTDNFIIATDGDTVFVDTSWETSNSGYEAISEIYSN